MTSFLHCVRASVHSMCLFGVALLVVPGCGPERNDAPAIAKNPPTFAQALQTSASMPTELRRAYIASVQEQASAGYAVQSTLGHLRFENAAQRATATLDSRGLFVTPIDGDWRWGLRTVDVGCINSARIPLADAKPQAQRNRVDMHRQDLDEWYLNGPLGMEQGFVLRQAPQCTGLKSIRMSVDGGLTAIVHNGDGAGRGQRIDFVDHEHQTRLVYSDLSVVDARGKTISSWMTVEREMIALEIDDAGAVYPLAIDPLVWTQQGNLYPLVAEATDRFGFSVAISGNTAVVGAVGDNDAGYQSGATYVFARNGSQWTQEAKLLPSVAPIQGSFAGNSVAIEGDTLVVGAPYYTTNSPYPFGMVYVYTRSNNVWTLQQSITRPAPESFRFGCSVAISGDTIVVGADGDYLMSPKRGRVYFYRRTNGQWNAEGDFTPSEVFTIDRFAGYVDIDGDTAIAGAPSRGTVYVYTRNGATWTPEATLAKGPTLEESISSAALFGDAVVAGLPHDSGLASRAGAALVYTRTAGTWSEQAKLVPQDPVVDGGVGSRLAFDGDVAMLVGGSSSSINNIASVYIFQRAGSVWTQEQKIDMLDPSFAGGAIWALSMSGKSAIAGFGYGTAQGIMSGTAGIFEAPSGALGAACGSAVDCTSGFCVDGVCCDSACGSSDTTDCQACAIAAGAASNGTCAPIAMGTVCRAPTGECDIAESCTGVANDCPQDQSQTDGTPCMGGVCGGGKCVGDGGSGGMGGSGGSGVIDTGGSAGAAPVKPTPGETISCSQSSSSNSSTSAWALAAVVFLAARRHNRFGSASKFLIRGHTYASALADTNARSRNYVNVSGCIEHAECTSRLANIRTIPTFAQGRIAHREF